MAHKMATLKNGNILIGRPDLVFGGERIREPEDELGFSSPSDRSSARHSPKVDRSVRKIDLLEGHRIRIAEQKLVALPWFLTESPCEYTECSRCNRCILSALSTFIDFLLPGHIVPTGQPVSVSFQRDYWTGTSHPNLNRLTFINVRVPKSHHVTKPNKVPFVRVIDSLASSQSAHSATLSGNESSRDVMLLKFLRVTES
jgi:hypothetical protein